MDEKIVEEIVTETIDNGTIENVHIAPIGKFYGSDTEGKPIEENITQDALEELAEHLNIDRGDILCDVDHAASKPGIQKDTRAVGWFTKFFVDPIKGLFASLKLTKHGKELLENKEYRYISPTFSLGEDGQPIEMHTASVTNLPAFAGYIDPILNQEAQPISDEGTMTMEMTKEDLIALVKETVKEMEAAKEKADEVEDKVEEAKEEVVEVAENSCSEEEV